MQVADPSQHVMKTCGYCGRENEDSVVVCRECGLSEFPETAEEKARAAQVVVEPEPEPPLPEVAADAEAAICPFCLFPNLPDRGWCKQCGAPFNTSVFGPFESALARGFLWRSVLRGRPKPLVFVATWMFCFPTMLGGVGVVWLGVASRAPVITAGGLLYAVLAAVLLFQVTRNFIILPKPKFDE